MTQAQGRRRRAITLLALALGVTALAVIATRPTVATSVAMTATRVQAQLGPGLAMTGIYLEETGIPMPVPSEINIGCRDCAIGENITAAAIERGIQTVADGEPCGCVGAAGLQHTAAPKIALLSYAHRTSE